MLAAATLALAIPIEATAAPAPTPIPIVNAGFEATLLANGAGDTNLPGWTSPGNQGGFNPTTSQLTGEAYEGENVAFSNARADYYPYAPGTPNDTIGQVLTTNLAASQKYTLSVQVGERKEGVPPGHRPYEVQLLAGGIVLDSVTAPEQVNDGWVKAEIVYFSDATVPSDQALEIRLIAGGVQLLWDDVQLTVEAVATPPAGVDDCKKGGWESLTDDEATPFRNQGDCVSYVATGGTNKASG